LKPKASLTHVDRAGRPAMVDVSDKAISAREAIAHCRVGFPATVAAQLRADGLRSKKGAVIDTAIIAGTMAVKRTHELIPFCHPLPIDGCRFAIDWDGASSLSIECTVKTTHRTGVEMEALTGATVAALTVYDMCKALSHAIVIGPAQLLGKRGGKRDFGRGDAAVAVAQSGEAGSKRGAVKRGKPSTEVSVAAAPTRSVKKSASARRAPAKPAPAKPASRKRAGTARDARGTGA